MATASDAVPLRDVARAPDDTGEAPTSSTSPSREGFPAYPERGTKAWLVVLGAWCAMVPPIGLVNSMGVLHAWVGHHQLEDYSQSAVGWIFSIHAFFLYIGSSQLGSVFDKYGVKPLVITGSVGYLVSIFALSFCTEYYQFLLAFGVLGGLSACCLFTPSVCAVGHWFSARRALATGVAYTSGSLGGVAFPFVILYLAPLVGYPWAIRVVGLLSAALFLAACVLLRTRVAPDRDAAAAAGLLAGVDLRALLRDPPFAAVTLAVFLVEFAVFVPLTYVSSYAIAIGVAPAAAYRLVALLNLGSVPGRVLPGYAADRWGRFEVMIATTLGSSLCILALWLPCGGGGGADPKEEALLTAFAVLFGFWSGASISLTPVCVAQVCRIEDYGKRNGTAYSLASVAALIGVPIAGALVDAGGGDYKGLILFAGGLYAVTAAAFVLARFVSKKSGLPARPAG